MSLTTSFFQQKLHKVHRGMPKIPVTADVLHLARMIATIIHHNSHLFELVKATKLLNSILQQLIFCSSNFIRSSSCLFYQVAPRLDNNRITLLFLFLLGLANRKGV